MNERQAERVIFLLEKILERLDQSNGLVTISPNDPRLLAWSGAAVGLTGVPNSSSGTPT